MDRWRVIEMYQKLEASEETIVMRWKQLNTLRQMAQELGIIPQEDEAEIADVRERWVRLKKEFGTR
jgi:hypothetical protein